MASIEVTDAERETLRDARIGYRSEDGYPYSKPEADLLAAVAQIKRNAMRQVLKDAAMALNIEGLSFKQGGWGSNPTDQAVSNFALKTISWLNERAEEI